MFGNLFSPFISSIVFLAGEIDIIKRELDIQTVSNETVETVTRIFRKEMSKPE